MSIWFKNLMSHAGMKSVLSFLIGWLIFLVGVNNWTSLGALGILCVLDFAVAIYICVIRHKRIYSNKISNKFGHFVMYTIGVITMHMLSVISGRFDMLTDVAIGWFGFTEAWSVAEHMAYLGYKIPLSVLKNIGKD